MSAVRSTVRCLTVLTPLCAPALAGPLNPPPGPIDASYRTLDQVCPGIPISTLAGSPEAVHVIQQQGRFILDADLNGQAGKHGILIDNPGGPVVIECNGYSITGVPGSLDGIHGRAARSVHLDFPIIGDWDGDGVDIAIETIEITHEVLIFKGGAVGNVAGDGFVVTMPPTPAGVSHTAIWTDMNVHDVGGTAIEVRPEFGGGLSSYVMRVNNVGITNAGAHGVHAQRGALGRYPVHVHRLSISGAGASGVLLDAPALISGDRGSGQPPAVRFLWGQGIYIGDTGLTALRVADAEASGDLNGFFIQEPDGDGMEVGDGFSISDSIVENAAGVGIRFGDGVNGRRLMVSNTGGSGVEGGRNASLSDLSVWNAAGDGVNLSDLSWVERIDINGATDAGIRCGSSSVVAGALVMNAGTVGIDAADRVTLSRVTVGYESAAPTLGAVFAGEYLVADAVHSFGTWNTQRGARISASLVMMDQDAGPFAPHMFDGGEHVIEGCDFRLLGNDVAKLPIARFVGNEIELRNSSFTLLDTPIDPVLVSRGTSEAVYIRGFGTFITKTRVKNIWSGIAGIGLDSPGGHHVIQDNTFIGARGLGAIGVFGVVNNTMIIGNTFSGLGPAGIAFDVPGSGNVFGPTVSGTGVVTNPNPDRNVVVP